MKPEEPNYISLYRSGELERRVERLEARLASCDICPRECRVNRLEGELGLCHSGRQRIVASVCAHHGEEPVLSGLHPDLTTQEKYYLNLWQHSAITADDVQDLETAVLYYNKIIEYFPDTKEALYAKGRLDVLMKVSGEEIKKHGRVRRRR